MSSHIWEVISTLLKHSKKRIPLLQKQDHYKMLAARLYLSLLVLLGRDVAVLDNTQNTGQEY